MKNKFQRVALALSLAVSAAAHAAPTGYQDQANFDAAIATFGSSQTVDFENVATGTTYASGTGTGGLTFDYSIPGQQLQVSSTFGTTSGTQYLGLDNPDTAFYLGDSFTINFNRSVNAAGLYLIAGSDAQAGDLQLSIGGATVSNSATSLALADGKAYFIGIIDPNASFTSITITGVPSGDAFLPFSADDIVSAVSPVPEPGAIGMMLAGLGVFGFVARRRRAGHSSSF